MGWLTPVAIKLGSFPWLPRLLPLIARVETWLRRLSRDRVGLLDVAGLPSLRLTVPGRRSGVPRTTDLLTVPWRGGWLVAGSYFGAPQAPAWARNLRAADSATIRYRGREQTVGWRELVDDERAAAWAAMVVIWPNFDTYAERTDRVIPVFHLTTSFAPDAGPR